MPKASADRVVCETPTPGKKPVRIDRWKYDAIRKAILKSIPRHSEGVAWKELPVLVEANLSEDEKDRLGHVGWYTITVKLDLEVKGEIKRLEGVKPQKLVRT
ncbi:hypothetical protein KQI84_14580 [bacterium]|nr:hypothetical protein [bacterium]